MPASDTWINRDALSDSQSGHGRPELADNAGRITADDFRHWYFDPRHSAPKKDVDVINRCGLHLDEDIIGAGLRPGNILVLKNVRSAVLVKNDCFHLFRLGQQIEEQICSRRQYTELAN